MRTMDRARLAALTVLAAVAGSASAGAAALARDGFCLHGLLGLTPPGAAMPEMHGMAMHHAAGAAASMSGACPILVVVAVAAAMLFAILLGAVRSAAAVVLAEAFRLLVPGADAPWASRNVPVLVFAGVRLARRRPSRAPP
ncbi:MAG: hypothetical protein QOJ39_3244, partial [Candidatus Eremiobacteraeota bacterium]|nr:hypothetical protein [Candidatus Eremiobacteraeota bacterium]